MNAIRVRRHDITLQPESARVIIRAFLPHGKNKISAVIDRIMALRDHEVEQALAAVLDEFTSRHLDIETPLLRHFQRVRTHVATEHTLSDSRKLLIGAMFSGEYALESSALFNPSIVPHPDQSDVSAGGLRFVMSLRATGEGHISSIEFRAGIVSPEGAINLVPASRYVTMPEVVQNPSYRKRRFMIKLEEMGFDNPCAAAVMGPLGEEFTRASLVECVSRVRRENRPIPIDFKRTLECIQWLADSNYEIEFSPRLALSERIVFPVSTNESNGIEDARFVRFVNDDGTVIYYATYTAYNGRDILPQMIETTDFRRFRVLTLNGSAVQNKGMALFPRRVNGTYAMLSRQDDENLFIMYSDSPHHWNDARLLMKPEQVWESVKIGNCGSPIETDAGWLVMTHGVGPMRKYCIGAALLDLENPGKVIGRLREPLIAPEGTERDGYVPNVVYSCGSLLHNNELILPYAMSDKATAIATIPIADLLAALRP